MDVFEITGFQTGTSRAGVSFLEPADSYQDIEDGFIYRQVLQSRRGISTFCDRLSGNTRVMGIFEFILPDQTKQLLAFDKTQMYVFNTTTGNFDAVDFDTTSSMPNYTSFGISQNEDYISGVGYPDMNGKARFVFTSRGMSINDAGSAIFFYDPLDPVTMTPLVKDYTSTISNPEYKNPVGQTLFRATHIIYKNERINFIVPEYSPAPVVQPQGVLFSGIRDASGNGDKFNTAGSGQIILSTFETIKAVAVLGQFLLLNLSGSTWTLEITRDAFNPWYPRRLPSVIGTDASFSSAQWNAIEFSMGKAGVIATDGRRSDRTDNKIPYFTKDEVDQELFEQCYGGYDRVTAQFYFNYPTGLTDIGTQDKILVHNYEESSWSFYNLRTSVFGETDIGLSLTWDEIDQTVKESWEQWDTTEEVWDKIGLGASVLKTLAGDDLGFIYEMNADYDDYFVGITGITPASNAVLTVAPSAFKAGDRVVVQNVEGMPEINNYSPLLDEDPDPIYTVVSSTVTSVTLDVDSTNFGTYTTGGTLSKLISFEAKTIPLNPYREQGLRIFVSMIEFLINTDGGRLYVDLYVNEESTPFKSNVLIKPTNLAKANEWVSMGVDIEADFITIVMRQQSPSVGIEIRSLRIHAEAGGLTNG